MGVPPYITFNPAKKEFGGIDVDFLKIIAQKFLLKLTWKPEKSWLEKLPNGSLAGSVASVSKRLVMLYLYTRSL